MNVPELDEEDLLWLLMVLCLYGWKYQKSRATGSCAANWVSRRRTPEDVAVKTAWKASG